MRLVDSCGWLEFFTDGSLADQYAQELSGTSEDIVVPSIVIHEVYKFLLRTAGEEIALQCAGRMSGCRVLDLGQTLAMESADLAIKHRLAMADAIILASALSTGAELVTSDADLEGLPSVRYLPKRGGVPASIRDGISRNTAGEPVPAKGLPDSSNDRSHP